MRIFKTIFGVLITGLCVTQHAVAVNTDVKEMLSSKSQNVNAITKQPNVVIKEIQQAVENPESLKPEQVTKYRQNLRDVKQQALQAKNQADALLNDQKELQSALGKAPEEGEDGVATKEDEEVAAQRQKIQARITELDGESKQAKLQIAKAEELLENLIALEQERLRTKLSSRIDSPFLPGPFTRTTKQALQYLANFQNWLGLGIIVVICGFLCWLMIPTARLLNTLLQKANASMRKPLSPYTFMQLVVAACVVLLFRFDLLDFEKYVSLEAFLQAIASIWLSLMMLRVITKVRFRPSEKTDQYGSKVRSYAWLWNGLRRLIQMALVVIPVLAVIGFIELSAYLSLNLLATLFGVLLFVILRNFAVRVALTVRDKRLHRSDDLSNTDESIATKKNREETEEKALSPLAISILEPVFALIVLGFILFFWGVSSEDFESWIEKYQNGIPVGNITLNFADMGAAISTFAVLFGITKVIQWFLSSRVLPHTALDLGIKNAVSTIIGYVGIIAAILSAMGALGLSMENLAIVAGALSVGIGFGLQAVFNNFVSGLILLFERPVKVGDWVIVGEHQGVIQKIRVRSTEIETFHNSTIIVPNSQLISETVTNWTLHNRVGRVDIQVGVAYGSDTDRVKEVLLDVANKSSVVRNYPKPDVLFMGFGDSSLDFELRCYISNIRDVFKASSNLRFAVDAAFRENNIEIPFPQRDLHVRSVDNGVVEDFGKDDRQN